MKKALLVVLFVCLGFVVLAQEAPPQDGQRGFGRGPGILAMTMSPEQVMEKFDVDKDGTLSVEEVAAWKADVEMKVYDLDRDGVITDEERTRVDEMKKRMEEMRKRRAEGRGPGAQRNQRSLRTLRRDADTPE